MRILSAAAALCLTSLATLHSATGLGDEFMNELSTTFLELGGHNDTIHSRDWYELWAIDLRSRFRDILSALQTRPIQGSPSSPSVEIDTSKTFTVAMVGDSTMRMQATGLSRLLYNMTNADGRRQCQCKTVDGPCICFKDGEGASNHTIALRFTYHRKTKDCFQSKTKADFVYFGCGLHILHYHPSRPITDVVLKRWTQYEKTLEDAVHAYRRSGRLRKGYLGEAFMTTHTIILNQLVDPMLGEILQYVHRNKTTLEGCYKWVGKLKLALANSELNASPEDICTRGYFADEGVVDLNKRAKAVMKRVDVPIVPSYEITINQDWATERMDGRHFPPVIPQELSNFLGIIATALREEKMAKAT